MHQSFDDLTVVLVCTVYTDIYPFFPFKHNGNYTYRLLFTLRLYILPMQYISVFYMNITVNTNYFRE
jgi:hypothetical protein